MLVDFIELICYIVTEKHEITEIVNILRNNKRSRKTGIREDSNRKKIKWKLM